VIHTFLQTAAGRPVAQSKVAKSKWGRFEGDRLRARSKKLSCEEKQTSDFQNLPFMWMLRLLDFKSGVLEERKKLAFSHKSFRKLA